jgi:hypothetical protein
MALTAAQRREHVGRIFTKGIADALNNEEGLFSINLRTIMQWIKAHKTDTAFSNEADRTEATLWMLREMFQRAMNRDPELNALNRRLFRKWIDGHLGYGEGIIMEPLGQ